MSVQIVGVHGVWNRQAGKAFAEATRTLSGFWTSALRSTLGPVANIEITVAYYAELLAREVAQGPEDPAHLSHAEQQILLNWASALGAPPEVAQGRLTQPARAAADWIARHFRLDGEMVRMLVSGFCREVHAYLHEPERRAAVRQTVADTMTEHRPKIVIGHSLGSVVAYETLWANPDVQVDLFITLGSPLAMTGVIFPHLYPATVDGKGARPPGVARWINIADPGDILAVPRGLAGYFSGIDADLTAPIGVFKAHKVIGYLASPPVAAAVATVLGGATG